MAGALKYIKLHNIGADKRVVVLLPDSGSRYLSKVFNDDWMRENGYFTQPCMDATVADVLAAKPQQTLISVSPKETILSVIGLMKAQGISQAPVIHEGRLVGIVREVDLLNRLLMVGTEQGAQDVVGDIVETRLTTINTDESLDRLMNTFVNTSDVALVIRPNTAVGKIGAEDIQGILTKIDVLDFVATHCL